MKTKRWYANKEFYDTEMVYVRNLELICSVFVNPMKERNIISDNMEHIMFGNIKALLVVHKRFLQELTSNCYDIDGNDHFEDVSIGGIFKFYIPFLKLYTDYIRCQKNFNSVYARVMKDKRITAFLDQCLLDPRCNGMNLSSFLIMPIQRIPRYRLLLQEILKHTDPSKADHAALRRAIDAISETARQCDESLDWDADEALLDAIRSRLLPNSPLPSSCTILRKVVATLVSPTASPDRVRAFFLTDRLLLTNDYSSLSTFTIRITLPLILCRFDPAPDDSFLLRILSKSHQLALRFQNSCEVKDLAALLATATARLHAHCAHCHAALAPAHCCLCQKCSAIVCEDCGGTVAELERAMGQEDRDDPVEAWEKAGIDVNALLCASCFQYARYYAQPGLTLQEAIAQGNGKERGVFVSPQFPPVLEVPDEERKRLPAGWEVALTKEGRRFYFNAVLWLSSWCFPSASWRNDAPVGYAKYYDENGKAFLYDAKKGGIPTKLQRREFHGGVQTCGLSSV
ncbi:hypothetical protein WA577_003879 [Blastocystis sp. JDR]